MNHNILLSIAKYSIWEAIRDRLLIFIISGVLLFFLVSLFVGELAITEGIQIQAATLAFSLRLFCVFTIGLFVITSMIREFNDKGFELILSRPVPRSRYFLGKYSGFAVVALFISLICALCLSIYAPISLSLIWSLSLFCELLIIIAFSLLALFSFNSITISFSIVMAFYFLSRSMEVIQLIGNSPILESNALSHKLINYLLDIIAYVLPDLYRFTQTDWVIYISDIKHDILLVLGQTLIYVVFLSSVALFDLYRKEL
jgi:Cu-processing system permease protein